jgi:hypothetical protein
MIQDKKEMSIKDYNDKSLEIIHKESGEYLKSMFDNISSMNLRLGILIGFNTSFVAFFSTIPSYKYFTVPYFHMSDDKIHSIYYVNQMIDRMIEFINWILLIKPVIGLCLISSLILAVNGLSPVTNKANIFPGKMLEKSKGNDESFLLLTIINGRNDVIKDLVGIVQKKGSRLTLSLQFLAAASVIVILTTIMLNP